MFITVISVPTTSTIIIILLIFLSMAYAIWKKYNQFATILTCLVLMLIGFSTYTTIFIRATQHPNINENNPRITL